MKVIEIRCKPLLVPYKKPYYWAQGSIDGACVVLVEILTDEGITGFGECVGTPTAFGRLSLKPVDLLSGMTLSPTHA